MFILPPKKIDAGDATLKRTKLGFSLRKKVSLRKIRLFQIAFMVMNCLIVIDFT